jgi:hypothetical protein
MTCREYNLNCFGFYSYDEFDDWLLPIIKIAKKKIKGLSFNDLHEIVNNLAGPRSKHLNDNTLNVDYEFLRWQVKKLAKQGHFIFKGRAGNGGRIY